MAVARACVAIARRVATRKSRRYRITSRGSRVDPRRTIRRNVKYGGTVLELSQLERKIRKPRIVVICDVSMAEMQGPELVALLRQSGRDVNVIYVTGYQPEGLGEAGPDTLRDRVLTKPFNDQSLIDAVNGGLELARRRLEEREKRVELRARFETLTAREREVMRLVVTGMLNKQIGATLGTTEKTIKAHRAQVMDKMHANSLAELVRMADRLDLMKPA